MPVCQGPDCERTFDCVDVGREREYCSPACQSRAWRARRDRRECIDLADMLAVAPHSALAQAAAALGPNQRWIVRRALDRAARGSEAPIVHDSRNDWRSGQRRAR